MLTLNDYNSRIKPSWCPGCGNFGIWGALKNALLKQNLSKDDVCLLYDVGCSGNMADFVHTYGIHTLHGRVISVAMGVSIANHQFPIVAIGGDGGIYGEGVEHFITACRANVNITAIVHNNSLYSLTTGQKSPLAAKGKKTKSTPHGVVEVPFQPLKSAIIHDAGFVARGFGADIPYLTELITQAMQHKGFSLVEVLQPCPTFNKDMSVQWYLERVKKLPTFDGLSEKEAFEKVDEAPDSLVTGVLYKSERPAYHEHFPQLQQVPLLGQQIETVHIERLINSFI